MIIWKDNIIGHLAKTGGNALNDMMLKANLNFFSDLHKPNKTRTFQDLSENIIKDKTLYLVIRRLPSWWKSLLWHMGKHTKLDKHNCPQKIKLPEFTYDEKFQKQKSFILKADLMCHSTFPDFHIQKHIKPFDTIIKYLRVENLQEDFEKYFDIKLPNISITKYTYMPPTDKRYWTEETKQILYENNPFWTNLEHSCYI